MSRPPRRGVGTPMAAEHLIEPSYIAEKTSIFGRADWGEKTPP